ncbi:hypothetical protein TRP8649_02160 [Pelagimonas phthalicica]|uniref:Uncharacterized protein n=1 Tax=Pelagimonas phthalicica TaxID=1037362 RepID=A0A238JBL0_9RHOB|nr:hypothetical protein CLV87_2162 [Pelagimonas phthalicica]SMX28048.1 hypothetical protein TRP8649_02160 [Pelagimonas phthalicica]
MERFFHKDETRDCPLAGWRNNFGFCHFFPAKLNSTSVFTQTIEKSPTVPPKAGHLSAAHLWCDGAGGRSRGGPRPLTPREWFPFAQFPQHMRTHHG